MISASLDALFVSPHPDDVEIFAGGTVARLRASGASVAILDLTRGELGSNGTPELRRQESEAAARALGLDQPRRCLDLGDGQLNDQDPRQVQAVAEALRNLRPRWLVGPAPYDRHPDHEAAHRLIRRAHFMAGLVNAAADGAPFRPDRLSFYLCHQLMTPSFVIDVSEFMAMRRDAIAAYASQFERGERDTPTPINQATFLPSLEARLAAYGQTVGVAFAEPFLHEGPLDVDPVSQFGRGRT